jgi:hypothetical protein
MKPRMLSCLWAWPRARHSRAANYSRVLSVRGDPVRPTNAQADQQSARPGHGTQQLALPIPKYGHVIPPRRTTFFPCRTPT